MPRKRDRARLSERQERILAVIRESLRERGFAPSLREIAEGAGLRSLSAVHAHLSWLEQCGYLRRSPFKRRAIELLDPEARAAREGLLVPVVGRVAAGRPILAEENVEEHVLLPREWVGEGPVFLLRVQGDSMVGAGICDGDLVAVRPQPTARDGEIVVALVDGEATVKRLFRDADAVRLVAENPAYPPIVSREVRVLGKVVGLWRRYG